MSDQVLSYKTQFKILQDQQEIMPANLKEYDHKKQANQAFLQHNSVEESKKQVAFIDKLLSENYKDEEETMNLPERLKLQLTEDDRMLLSNRKTMGLANILLNTNSKEDSPEMTDVKVDVINLVKTIEKSRILAANRENMDRVDVAFKMAIDSCKHYISVKNPRFKTGKERRRMVIDVCQSLIMEAEIFAFRKKVVLNNPDEEGNQSVGDLLGMNDEIQLERPKTKKEEAEEAKKARQQARQPQQAEGQANKAQAITYPEEVKYVKEILGEGYNFTDKIKAKYKSAKDRTAAANKVMALYESLKLFTPGNVELAEINVLGKKVKLLQKSDNSTYMILDHKEYPLGRTIASTSIQIENEIFKNPEVYGNERINDLLSGYERQAASGAMSAGENNRIRTLLSDFLAHKTGLVNNEFNNTFRRDLGKYIKDLLAGKKTGEQIRAEVEDHNKNDVFINGVAISEMVELNRNKSIDQIEAVVLMNTKEEKEVVEYGWTEEEQHVKNMIADVIFSNDTEKMDAAMKDPAGFLRDMIKRHKAAFVGIKASGKDPEEFVKTVLNKMSLGSLRGQVDGNDLNLVSVLSHTMAVLCDFAEDGEIDDDALISIKNEIDTAVDQSCKILQANVDVMSGVIFPEEEKQAKDQKKDHRSIRQKVADISKSDSGQGKFMKNAFKTYFAKANTVDKRAMLASVIRTAKNIPDGAGATDDQLVDEIKAGASKKFRDVFKDKQKKAGKDGKTSYELTDRERQTLEEYKQFKHTLRIQSNFMAGLIRGAGPLMHKMMQGLPISSLPAEIREAVGDVKSNLPPIPDHVVQSEFLSLVESSHGNVTKIEKLKSLGAGSVGQTFLCKVYGPAPELKNGKDVVIKLLRPEAKNRMQREEDIMLAAARETDEAMYLTYKDQLDNFKKELDLSIEGNNCQEGIKNYGNKFADVKTMKVLDGIPSTNTSLVLEKAEGDTLDKYIKDLDKYKDEVLGEFYQEEVANDGTKYINKDINLILTKENEQKIIEKKKLLLDKIDQAVKRRDHIVNLCDAWIDQAIMNQESGFYHGDLHAGNIIVNDNEATFIDYGNTVQLNQEQQKCIARMAIAATFSIESKASENPIELFFGAFNDLVTENADEAFNAMYTEEKKAKLKEAFREVLREGTEQDTGFRITLCLARAQELGIKLSPAIQSFSRGQIRLQNSIDEMNRSIENLKKGIEKLDAACGMDKMNFDPVNVMTNRIFMDASEGTVEEKYKRFMKNLQPVDEETFKKGLVDNTKKEGDPSKGIKPVDKRQDFKMEFVENYAGLVNLEVPELQAMGLTAEQIKELGYDTSDLEPVKTYRQIFSEYYEKYKDQKGSNEQKTAANKLPSDIMPLSAFDGSLDAFGGNNFLIQFAVKAAQDLDWGKMEELLDILEKQVPKAFLTKRKIEKLWEKQDSKKLKKAEQEPLVNEIYTAYNELHLAKSRNDYILTNLSIHLDQPDFERSMYNTISPLFDIQQDGLGQTFKEKYEAYKAIKEKYKPKERKGANSTYLVWEPEGEDVANFKRICDEFMDAYAGVVRCRLKEYADAMFGREVNIKYVDYDDVMQNVMQRKFPANDFGSSIKAIKKVGEWLGKGTTKVIGEAMGGTIGAFIGSLFG